MVAKAYWQLSKWDRIIRRKPYESWKQYLASPKNVEHHSNLSPVILSMLTKHVSAVARTHSSDMNCMRRCLALKTLIEQRQGLCQFHIGVKIDHNGLMQAHSWLSANGVLVNDSIEEVSRYKEITHNNTLFEKTVLQTNTVKKRHCGEGQNLPPLP